MSEAIHNPLPEAILTELEQLAQAASDGPWEIGRSGTTTLEDACAWACASISERDEPELWGVFVGPPGQDRIVALTGNGPHSQANARYIEAIKPTTVLCLIANLRRLLRERG